MFTHPSQNMDLSDLFKDNSVNFSVMHKSYSEILLVMLRRKLHIESTLPRNSFHRLTGQRKIMSGMTPPISQRRLLSNNSVKMLEEPSSPRICKHAGSKGYGQGPNRVKIVKEKCTYNGA